MSKASIRIAGKKLIFEDKLGDSHLYEGFTDDSVELTGNIGIIGESLYYKDEEGIIRKVPIKEKESTNIRRGSLWVSEDISALQYVDENGDKVLCEEGSNIS